MTILIPSSNISVKLKKMQKTLFKNHMITPAPFPLILCSTSTTKPARPSRSTLSENYPSEIQLMRFREVDGNLMLMFDKPFCIKTDKKYIDGIIFGQIDPLAPNLSYPKITEPFIFKNFSIASFEVHSESMFEFWMNMKWVKLWEVQKKKT